jgi:hypothetical protein
LGIYSCIVNLVQAKTAIPIPKIVEWSSDSSNCVGSEYIIMEYAQGVRLLDKWEDLAGDIRVKITVSLYQILKEMVDLTFPAYGSIYHASDFSSEYWLDGERQWCIGPHCGAIYWDCAAGESRYYHAVKPNQGPCKNSVFTNKMHK